MITRNLTLTITDKSVSLDKSVILYQYDRGITLNIKLDSKEYLLDGSEIVSARAIIMRPNKSISTTDIEDIVDGVFTLYLDDTWADDNFEIGTHQIQLQLYSNNSEDECITIQPFSIEVKQLIGIPSSTAATVGNSTVGNYSVKASEELPKGDLDNGEYLETNWINGDLITSGKLNKVEGVLDYLVAESINYATESYVNEAIAEAQLSGDGEDIDLSIYALKTDIPTIPTNVSEFTNDAGYLTEHQSLENYALKSEVPSIEGLATETYVNDAIANIDVGDVDLTDYALKSEIPSISGLVSSNSVIRIEVVSELPEVEEEGVLYIVK